jgi:hypothetical protein
MPDSIQNVDVPVTRRMENSMRLASHTTVLPRSTGLANSKNIS